MTHRRKKMAAMNVAEKVGSPPTVSRTPAAVLILNSNTEKCRAHFAT